MRLEQASSKAGKTLSDYIREVLSQHTLVTNTGRWKVTLWSLLGVNIVKTDHALKQATSVEQFFALVSNFMWKGIEVRPNMPRGYIDLDFIINDRTYNIQQEKRHPLEDAIAQVVQSLENKIMEDYDEQG